MREGLVVCIDRMVIPSPRSMSVCFGQSGNWIMDRCVPPLVDERTVNILRALREVSVVSMFGAARAVS